MSERPFEHLVVAGFQCVGFCGVLFSWCVLSCFDTYHVYYTQQFIQQRTLLCCISITTCEYIISFWYGTEQCSVTKLFFSHY